MLNKLKFNNLVISNKKGIQQSRTQTINKLVHKIRKLKTLLEKQPDNIKCKERIRKSTETMDLLKKFKRMDIMKKVLLLDIPAPAVITNGFATPEELAIALLCMNKVMQGLIKRFKIELQLNEAESDEWKLDLKESSKRRQKIERTEEKRRKRLEIKQQKVMGRKRQEWLEENQEDTKKQQVVFDDDLNVATTAGWQIEELSKENEIKKGNEKIFEKKPVQELDTPLKDEAANKRIHIPNKKQKKFNENKEFEHLVDDEILEKDIKPLKKEKRAITDLQDSKVAPNTDEEPEEEMVVDPFFITDTGENYLSSAVIRRYRNAENENNEEKRDLHMIKLNNYDRKLTDRKGRHQQSRNKNQKDFSENKNSLNREQGKDQKNKWNKERNNFSQNKWNDKKSNSGEKNLHPSWAAKQKFKPIITGFQVKKITFGDEDNSNASQQQSQKANKSVTPKSIKSEQDALHPSWAAKQKQKPTITAFQGKKITFDNDE